MAVVAVVAGLLTAGCGGSKRQASGNEGLLRIGIGADPVLEPGQQPVEPGAATVVYSLLDPLVRLGKDRRAVPSLAKTWDFSDDGLTVTFHLRTDGRWTSGDPVTARDFEYSWKRTLSPELGATYAYELYGIAGAEKYSHCKPSDARCAGLADQVGVRALDDRTLEVRLAAQRPWFVEEAAHWAFLPVHRATVERWGDAAWEPGHLVTNGPFRLDSWKHDDSLALVKNEKWREADQVAVKRVAVAIVTDPLARVQAFEAGRLDALNGLFDLPAGRPGVEAIEKSRGSGSLAIYPQLGASYYGINVGTIPDPVQRRAMALALDREAIVSAIGNQHLPATSWTPPGMPGYDTIAPGYLESASRLADARELMASVHHPKTHISLYTNDAAQLDTVASEARKAWREIGISTTVKVLEWASYLDLLGPPLSRHVDVFQLGWIADYPDDYNFLSVFRCNYFENVTGFCDPEYDRWVDSAVTMVRKQDRWKVYSRAEERLTGPSGAFPIIPTYWYTFVNLEAPSIAKTYNFVPYGQVDLSEVKFESS
jgi:oligopeptide transport system substrate-binding protein